VAGCCEYGNEPSGFMKHEQLIDRLNYCQLLKADCAQIVSGDICGSPQSLRGGCHNNLLPHLVVV
jgi:hypothetical protein